jgi:hypothetical protein
MATGTQVNMAIWRWQVSSRFVLAVVLLIGIILAVVHYYLPRFTMAKRLQSIGSIVEYAYEHDATGSSRVPEWLNRLVGTEVFNSVDYIDLTGSSATDADVARLARSFPEMEALNLDFTKISDKALAELPSLTKLKVLMLGHCDITDAGVETLKNCTSLQGLALDLTYITDDSVESLSQMTGLRELIIGKTFMTPEGCRAVRTALSTCVVEF